MGEGEGGERLKYDRPSTCFKCDSFDVCVCSVCVCVCVCARVCVTHLLKIAYLLYVTGATVSVVAAYGAEIGAYGTQVKESHLYNSFTASLLSVIINWLSVIIIIIVVVVIRVECSDTVVWAF